MCWSQIFSEQVVAHIPLSALHPLHSIHEQILVKPYQQYVLR
jgi:hypothetical protein